MAASAGGVVFGTAKAIITLDVSGVVAGAQQAINAFGSVTSATAQASLNSGRSLRSMSEQATGITRGLTAITGIAAGIGGGIAAGLGAAAKEFIGFNTVIQNIASLGSQAAESIGALQPKIFGLATELGKSPTELADALYNVASAGFSTTDSLTIVTAGAKAAVAGLTDTATATDLISSILLSYGEDASHANEVSNILFATVQVGRVRFQDLATTLGLVSPTARVLGVTLQETGAAMAALTNQGLTARQASNQLNSAFQTLIKPNQALTGALQEYGFASGQALIASKGLGGALQFLDQISGNNATTLTKLLGNQRAARAVFILNADGASQYTKALEATNAAQEGSGATATALAEQEKSTSFQIAQAKAAFQVFADTIGAKLAPAINFGAQALKDFGLVLTTVFNFLDKLGLATPLLIVIALVGAIATGIATFGSFAIVLIRVVESLNAMAAGSAKTAAANAMLAASTEEATIGLEAETVAVTEASTAARLLGSTWGVISTLAPIALVATIAIPLAQSAIKDAEKGGGFWGTTFGLAAQGAVGKVFDLFGSHAITDATKTWQSQVDAQKFVIHAGLSLDTKGIFGSEQGDAGKAVVTALGQSIDQLQASAKAANETFGQYVLEQLKVKGVSSDVIDAVQQQVDAQDGLADSSDADTAAAQAQQQEYQDLSDSIGSLGKKVSAADAAFDQAKTDFDLTLPLTASADAFKTFNTQLNQLVSDTQTKLGDITSVADPLSFLTSQLDRSQTTVAGLFLRMQQLGFGINFTPAEQQALSYASAIENVDNHLKTLSDEISQNANDISMWQGRIDLVDSVLGDSTDTLSQYQAKLAAGTITQQEYNDAIDNGQAHEAYANLKKLLTDGKLTQQEYNAALAAGIDIRQRSVGGIEDEEAAQAKLLPQLDKWINAHDTADAKIKTLSSDQQSFLSVLNDTNTQQALATVQLVSYLASIGQIPKDAVTQVVTDLSNSDPQLHALFSELGLLQDPVTITVKADTDAATTALHDIGVQKDALLAQQATLQVQLAGKPGDPDILAQISATQGAIDQLNTRQINISGAVNSGDDAKIKQALTDDQALVDQLNKSSLPGGTGPVLPTAAGTGAAPTAAAPGGSTAPVTVPVTTAADGTGSSPADVLASIDSQIADAKAQIKVSITQQEADQQIDALEASITQAKSDFANATGQFTTIGGQVFDKSTQAGIDAFNAYISDIQSKEITVRAEIAKPDVVASQDAIQAQLDQLTASRDRLSAAMLAQANNPGVLNDLTQVQTALSNKVAALSALTDPSSKEQQELQAFKAQLLEVNQLLNSPETAKVDTTGLSDADKVLAEVAKELGLIADPKDITITTNAAQDQVIALGNSVVSLDGQISGLADGLAKGDADALAQLKDFTAKRDQALVNGAILTISLDPTQVIAADKQIQDQIAATTSQVADLENALGNDPNNKGLQDQLTISQDSLDKLQTFKELTDALATGSESSGLALLQQRYADVSKEISDNPLFGSVPFDKLPTQLQQVMEEYQTLGKLVGNGADNTFSAQFQAAVELQTTLGGDPASIAAAKAAATGTPLPGTTANVAIATPDQQKIIDQLNSLKDGVASLDKAGNITFSASGLKDVQAAVETIFNTNEPTLKEFQSIKFKTDGGQDLSPFTAFLNTIHDKLGETFGPKYTAFLDANADGVITNTDLAKKGLEDIAKRWTAFISADSTSAQDAIDFIDQRLADLGNPTGADGEHLIDIHANADQALAIIKGVNDKIDDSHLNGKLLTELDANNDGFLSAAEIARVDGKNLADAKFVASLELTTTGDDDVKTKLKDVKNVAVDLTSEPGVVQITAKTDAEAAKFLDENKTQLEGKTVSVTVVNPDGSIKTIQDFQIADKTMVVHIQDQEFQTFLGATVELDQDGVTFDVIANSKEAAQKLIDLNAKTLDGKTVNVFVKDDATGTLTEIDSKKITDKDVKVNVTGTAVDANGNPTDAPVTTITADNSKAVTTAAQTPGDVQTAIDKQPKPTVTIQTTTAATGVSASTVAGSSDGVTAAASASAAAAQAAVNGIVAILDSLPAQMSQAGLLGGGAFAASLGAELALAPAVASANVDPIIGFLFSLQGEMQSAGGSLGFSFDLGLINGIVSGQSAVESFAVGVALSAYYAAKNALGIHSPSTKGQEIGAFFTIGVANGVASETDRAGAASKAVALKMAKEFESVTAKPMTVTGILGGKASASAGDISLTSKPAGASGGANTPNNSVTHQNITIPISGAGDPAAVANEVYRKLVSAADRLSAGGVVVG